MSDKSLHVRCDCSCSLHFVEFDHFDDEREVYVSYVSDVGASFWQRFLLALKYVLFGKKIVLADIVLSPEKSQEIARFLDAVSSEVAA